MKPRSLVAAAIVLAALSAGVWWAKKHPQSENSTTASTVKLLNIPADQVQQIDVKKKDGTGIDLKRANGKWQEY